MSLKIFPHATVCAECEFVGDITIGSKTVIHPKASIIAEGGPIVIGNGNLIEEQVKIINRLPPGTEPGGTSQVMTIGNYNVFEVGAHSQAAKIGDHNILEAKSVVGQQMELTNGCVVGANCVVTGNEVLPENSVIYGSNCDRRIQAERPAPQTLQLDFLSKVLPNYHNILKPQKK